MKKKNRDINVFSLSLLDILCGALGGFAFLLILVLPHYKPNAKDVPEDMVDPKTYEEALEQIRQLKGYLSTCRGDRDACESTVDRQEKQITQLSMRNPLTFVATFSGPHDFDLFIEDDRHNAEGGTAPRVDPTKKQWTSWTGDMRVDYPAGINSEIWTIRDAPEGSYRVYYKLLKKVDSTNPTEVVGVVVLSQDKAVFLPRVQMMQEGQVVRVATVNAKQDGHATVTVNVQQ